MNSPLPAVLALAATWVQTGGASNTPTPGDDFYLLLITLGQTGFLVGCVGLGYSLIEILSHLKPPKGGMYL